MCQNVGKNFTEIWQSFGKSFGKSFWKSFGRVLAECWQSFGRDLAEFLAEFCKSFDPSLNTQSCNRGLLVVRDFCFWAVLAAGPIQKKKGLGRL